MSNSQEHTDTIQLTKIQNKFININNFEIRDYQLKITYDSIGKNSLVVLPTGLGKTIIAVLIAAFTLENFPNNSKIIIMAPTRPLINQHFETFKRLLNLTENSFYVISGRNNPEERPKLFLNHQILFFTPHTLRNDLVNKRYSLKNTCLIIFDEAHHAAGEYPYTLIADEYIEQNPDGIILGMTASPGASKEKINKLCKNLYIPLKNIHLRVRKDLDVKDYLKPLDIYKIGVNLTLLMEDSIKAIKILLEERLQYLSQLNFIKKNSEELYKSIIRKDLLKINNDLITLLKKEGDKSGLYSAISINAQALILYHMIELIEQQGLDVLLMYLEKLQKEALKENSSKANRILANDYRIRQIFLELIKNQDLYPNRIIHPKLQILKKIILDELIKNNDSRILVFVKLRASVQNIVNKLNESSQIHPIRFVGQSTKSNIDKGLNQKEQIKILNLFRNGTYNVLVSTNVAEEGLDIAECDLVIFYDVVASEIRLIQRKGRTARHRKGKVIILYCRDTNDEIYLDIALKKLYKMQKNLNKSQKIKISSDKIDDKKQLNLGNFLKTIDKNKNNKIKIPIKISRHLNMKYGLRRRLIENKIPFIIVNSPVAIEINQKIQIQIYSPKEFDKNILIEKNSSFLENSSLIIYIIEFIRFHSNFDNECQLLKEKFLNFGKENHIKIINIDTSEELFFILKNIYECNNRGDCTIE